MALLRNRGERGESSWKALTLPETRWPPEGMAGNRLSSRQHFLYGFASGSEGPLYAGAVGGSGDTVVRKPHRGENGGRNGYPEVRVGAG